MRIRRLGYDDVLYIACHMREHDRREVYANRPSDDPYDLAAHICRAAGEMAWTAHGDRPIAAFGALCLWPGVWSAWLFATDDFPRIGPLLTRFCIRHVAPQLMRAGAHRIQCASLIDHIQAHRWLQRLGARREAVLHAYGKDREDFVQFVWHLQQDGILA